MDVGHHLVRLSECVVLAARGKTGSQWEGRPCAAWVNSTLIGAASCTAPSTGQPIKASTVHPGISATLEFAKVIVPLASTQQMPVPVASRSCWFKNGMACTLNVRCLVGRAEIAGFYRTGETQKDVSAITVYLALQASFKRYLAPLRVQLPTSPLTKVSAPKWPPRRCGQEQETWHAVRACFGDARALARS